MLLIPIGPEIGDRTDELAAVLPENLLGRLSFTAFTNPLEHRYANCAENGSQNYQRGQHVDGFSV